MTIDELIGSLKPKSSAPAAVETDSRHHPWWVVVVNPRRSDPSPKWYFGYVSEKEAVAVAADQNERAKIDAQQRLLRTGREFKPFVYHAVEAPRTKEERDVFFLSRKGRG